MHGKTIAGLLTTAVFGSPFWIMAASPDPDLFDGRVDQTESRSEAVSSAKSDSADSSQDEGGEGASGGDRADSSEGEGEGKAASGGGGVGTSEGESGEGGASGGGSDSAMPEAGGAGGSDAETVRSFEDFGFGGAGAEERVEVNRSKEGSNPIRSAGNRSDDSNTMTDPPIDATTETQTRNPSRGRESSGGTQGSAESGGGDFGTDVPSGL